MPGSRITAHNAWDRDQQYFSWDQGSNFCGFRDQNSHHFWDQGSNFWGKYGISYEKIYLVTTLTVWSIKINCLTKFAIPNGRVFYHLRLGSRFKIMRLFYLARFVRCAKRQNVSKLYRTVILLLVSTIYTCKNSQTIIL